MLFIPQIRSNVVEMTRVEPPAEASHWRSRILASGASVNTVQRVWKVHGRWKVQIQALERTQRRLPMARNWPATQIYDYIDHGTTTLFATLNVLEETVLSQCGARHRHQGFIRFLNAIKAAVLAGKVMHVILANYATDKHPKLRAWLDDHAR